MGWADPGRLTQAFWALLSVAQKHGNEPKGRGGGGISIGGDKRLLGRSYTIKYVITSNSHIKI